MSEHLRAALEVWRYCAESAAYIFGKRSGDPIADEILVELRKRGSLDRTAIRDLFSKHQNVARINEALNVLQSLGRVRVEQVPTEGRPREVWHAL
jgi:predicted DsbA family dithiol-disulfide isomerase